MELSLTSIKKTFSTILHRFHAIIFVVVVAGGLSVVVLLLNNIITKSSDANDTSSVTQDTSFDQATIKQINQLKSRDAAPTPLDLSQGRTSPFGE